MLGVTLQINTAPTDGRHLGEILPHQLRQFGGQVDEILIVVDRDRPRTVDPEVWRSGDRALRQAVDRCRELDPRIRVVDVDSSSAVADRVAEEYFGGVSIPERSWRGGPIYPYFYGLWAARHDYVLHMDADMLYGGGSQRWVAEAVELLRSRPDVLVCSPVPGPPRADGRLVSQDLPREPLDSLAFRAAHEVSTRVFMTDRRRWLDRLAPLVLSRPSLRQVLIGHSNGNGPYASAERSISEAMVKTDMTRIDFLGSGPGMWSLHPPYRCEPFYEQLPELVARVEAGDVPDIQRGRHDVHDAMVDWSAARRRWPSRMVRHVHRAVRRVSARLPWTKARDEHLTAGEERGRVLHAVPRLAPAHDCSSASPSGTRLGPIEQRLQARPVLRAAVVSAAIEAPIASGDDRV